MVKKKTLALYNTFLYDLIFELLQFISVAHNSALMLNIYKYSARSFLLTCLDT